MRVIYFSFVMQLVACSQPAPVARTTQPDPALQTIAFSVESCRLIGGSYAAFESGKFCRCWDTLIIRRDPQQPNRYNISRRTVFQRNLDIEYFPVEEISCRWSGLYDESTHVLLGFNRATTLRIFPGRELLQLNGMNYRKTD